jgi:hypothetical protein
VKYLAVSLEEGGEWDATVQADVGCDSLARSGRLARAMKAVLLAAKAWARRWPRDRTLDEQRAYEIATARLLAAQERLAKIEKEVSRG